MTAQQLEKITQLFEQDFARRREPLEHELNRTHALLSGKMYQAAPLPIETAPGAKKPAAATPPVGAVMDGYEFTGGDPSKKENWQKLHE